MGGDEPLEFYLTLSNIDNDGMSSSPGAEEQ